MRYCLSCRRLSANTPICTSCGASFGGALCSNKKCRFLNPPRSHVCGKCGTTTLLEAASSLQLTLLAKILAYPIVLWLVVGFARRLSAWGLTTFRSLTGCCDPLVWLIDQFFNGLVVIVMLYLISALLPGEAGQRLRGLMTNFFTRLIKMSFAFSQKFLFGAGKLLVKTLRSGKDTKV